jgi:signal transduction histidine kinase
MAATIGAAWLLRTRQIKLRFAAVLSERTRVAREIHDSVLQNLGAIALELDNLGSQMEAVTQLRSNFDTVRRHIEECIRETRQSIWDLRTPLHTEGDLPVMLREHAKSLIAGRHIDFDLAVHGTPAALSQEQKEQLVRIGQEALTNAVRHSQAKQIHAELSYEGGVTLSIRDDGTGFSFDEAVGRDAAHWGLVGMYERAARIGARLLVKSAPDCGTEVRVFVP